MNCMFVAAAGIAAFISLVSAAKAADLEIARGEVLLSRGSGYRPVRSSMQLRVGDTVVGKPDSAAKVTFADGCSIHLDLGLVFTVEGQSPCASGAAAKASQANSAFIPDSGESPNSTDSWIAGTETFAVTDDTQTNIWPYVLGAAAVGGIAAAASTLGGGNDGSPVSP